MNRLTRTKPNGLNCSVTPMDKPAVAKADTTSNKAGNKESFSTTIKANVPTATSNEANMVTVKAFSTFWESISPFHNYNRFSTPGQGPDRQDNDGKSGGFNTATH